MNNLADLDASALALATDLNLQTHASWIQRRTDSMQVREDGILLSDSGLPCDTFNLACGARFAPADALVRARLVPAWFAALGHPFSWWVGPADRPANLGEVLLDIGLEPAETEVGMSLGLDRLPAMDPPAGLEIRRVGDLATLRAFAAINAANWDPPDPDVLRFYDRAAPVVLTEACPLRYYVGYLDGEPVGTSLLVIGGGVVGLYNISTIGRHRRKGIGSALTLRPLIDARAAGHRVAILQASPEGVSLYARIGFRECGLYVEYKPPRQGSRY